MNIINMIPKLIRQNDFNVIKIKTLLKFIYYSLKKIKNYNMKNERKN